MWTKLFPSLARRRVERHFRVLALHGALNSDRTIGEVAMALELAYDDAQDQLPGSARLIAQGDVDRMVEDTITLSARLSLQNIAVQRPAALEYDADLGVHVSEGVRHQWGAALDELRVLQWVAFEEGRDFHLAVPDSSAMRHALVRLHARAITVADEVICLLAAGLASGGFARWRTLHELGVTAAFIAKHGEAAAERYLAHRVITRHRQSEEYQRHVEKLGEPPLSKADLEYNRRARDAAVTRFGSAFRQDHGWAAVTLGRKRVTFRDLEDEIRHDHLRPYYQHASGDIHAGAHGLLLAVTGRDEQMLKTGRHAEGLTDPLQLTAISIRGVTMELLLSQTTGSGLRQRIVHEVLDGLLDRVAAALPATSDERSETIRPSAVPPSADETERPLSAWPMFTGEEVDRILSIGRISALRTLFEHWRGTRHGR